MANVEKIVNQICNFVAYVDSFYNEKTGIYPIKGMTNSMVIKAVQKHIEKVGQESVSYTHLTLPTKA